MKQITMYRAEDGKLFDDEDECQEYEANFIVKKYEKLIKFWDYDKKPIALIDILVNSKFNQVYYFQIQRCCKCYDDLIEDLSVYLGDVDVFYKHEDEVGDIIFYDEDCGWISLEKRVEETTALLEELRGY